MKKRIRTPLIALTAMLLSCHLASVANAKEPRLSVEELISRHLESIGPPEARAAVSARRLEGNGLLTIRLGGSGNLPGRALLLSQGRKVKFQVLFDHPDYRAEQLLFDGKERHIGSIAPGSRSPLGQLAFSYGEMLNEGLLGGVLSTACPLLHLEERQPRLRYRGLKKVKGRRLHRLEYQMKKSGDLRTDLYFDPETFHHVLTKYEIRIKAGIGATPESSPGQRDTIIRMEESFEDFRELDGLTLPVAWSIRVWVTTAQKSTDWKWEMDFESVAHNPSIQADAFLLR